MQKFRLFDRLNCMIFKSLIIFVLSCSAYVSVHAQSVKTDFSRLWLPVGGNSTARSKAPDVNFLPDRFAHFSLDESSIQSALSAAPRSAGLSANSKSLVLPVPLPDGRMVDLYFEETLHMEPELASQFPSIRFLLTPVWMQQACAALGLVLTKAPDALSCAMDCAQAPLAAQSNRH